MDPDIQADEVNLRKQVKSAGSTWNVQKQVWQLPYKQVPELKLENRIVNEKNV